MSAQTVKTFQQSELNAVIMYRYLASKTHRRKDKQLLFGLAAEEGKHAATLKKITGESLKPEESLKRLVSPVYKIFGRKILFLILAVSEKAAGKMYRVLFKSYPETRKIAEDESRHGDLLFEAL